ncbi:COG4280 domain-containing protein [Deinococcus sp.]|uniref:COG4280 domain-containing protein n=1 Tax=Deinococcus sp. TaxID=47478 RepID=UPI003CC63134
MNGLFLVLASFLASAVEMVEALTIVLAVGLTRGWRSSLIGTGAALLTLALIVALFGPVLYRIPLETLRLVVGGLLLVFGLQWWRKAILRASGFKALHDEDAAFAAETEAARLQGQEQRAGLDWYGFTLAFKSVLLEGLEVAFIIVTFGATAQRLDLAIYGAAAALVLVLAAGALLHRPLSRVPENTLKFTVGLLLSTFGTFWAAEGAGVTWPGADASILGILAVYALASFIYVALLRREKQAQISGKELRA